MFLGVGWGNNVHILAHSHDVTPRHVHLHVRTYVMLRWRCVTSRRGGVGWGTNVHVHFACSHRKNQFVKKIRRHAGKTFWVHTGTIDSCWRMIGASVPDQLTSCPENEQKLVAHMAVAMGGKCSWKSPVGENRCVLSEDVEITGKNGCRWGFGYANFPKGTFSHSDMSTIYSKSQWKFKIKIELTFMDSIKTWKNTAKRMIDLLPVTWRCCFYSAHFQPCGMFEYQRMVVPSNVSTKWFDPTQETGAGIPGWGISFFCSLW